MPKYLQRVKREVDAEQRYVAVILGLDGGANDGAPPGHRVLPEVERLQIMNGLEERKKELDSQHARLPLSLQTEPQRQRGRDLEGALRSVEQDLHRFAKARVLVKT